MSRTLDRTRHFINTSSAFINNAVQRRTNKQRYIQADRSTHEVILRDGLMSVRHYKPLTQAEINIDGMQVKVKQRHYAVPIVLVPPLGVFAWIFDLLADRSMVQYFLAHGFEVYLVDWGTPRKEDADLSLENYINDWFPKIMQVVREHSASEEQSLVGYCMGGLLAALYMAASKDEKIVNLVTIASPIDMHKMGFIGTAYRLLSKPLWGIGKVTGLKITEMENRLFHVPGKQLSFAFKMTNPLGTVSSYVELLRNLGDDEYVSRYMTMNEWFTNMPDYPGATIQELIRKLGLYNRMAKGKLRIGDKVADFANINANLLAFAGDNDKIVSIPAAEAIMDVVSSQDRSFHIVPGGHAGVFTGGKAAHTTWAISRDWLAPRSRPYVFVDAEHAPGEVVGEGACS